jgi:hypothetical protein
MGTGTSTHPAMCRDINGRGRAMTDKEKTTLQEIYFDLCDLIDSGQVHDIALTEFQEFNTVLEFLEEQRDKIARFT